MKRTSFRTLLARDQPLIVATAHDALSARLITEAGFDAVGIGGMGMLASQFALPDIGLAALSDMLAGAQSVMRGTHLPVAMDADDGYGDIASVVRTVRAYESTGLGMLILEDQSGSGKRPGEGQQAVLMTPQEMCLRLKAALAARGDPETMIFARTDAFATVGFDEALRRASAYVQAGCDGVFVAGLQTPEQLQRAGRELRGIQQLVTVSERLLGLLPPPAELFQWGFQQIVYPQHVLIRSVLAMRNALAELRGIASGAIHPNGLVTHRDELGALQSTLGLAAWQAIRSGAADS